mmetsp:Transcript_56578/g.93512  ORF Transcript_56578/g.93512 Transcript_56578/m.93512 type:complete len:229 (-) Transcript_56578:166-852(-)
MSFLALYQHRQAAITSVMPAASKDARCWGSHKSILELGAAAVSPSRATLDRRFAWRRGSRKVNGGVALTRLIRGGLMGVLVAVLLRFLHQSHHALANRVGSRKIVLVLPQLLANISCQDVPLHNELVPIMRRLLEVLLAKPAGYAKPTKSMQRIDRTLFPQVWRTLIIIQVVDEFALVAIGTQTAFHDCSANLDTCLWPIYFTILVHPTLAFPLRNIPPIASKLRRRR